MSDKKFQYIMVDFESKPFYYTKIPSPPILMTKTEAYDLNKMLTLNGESKRYVEVWKHYIIPKIVIKILNTLSAIVLSEYDSPEIVPTSMK